MGYVAEKWKIEAVLALVRATCLCNFVVAGLNSAESKTSCFMRRIGFDPDQVFHVAQSLGVEDYSQGPLRDDKGRDHDLWVFGTYVQAFEVYVKLVACMSKSGAATTCVSFHEAEYPLPHPYAKKGQKYGRDRACAVS